MATNPDQEQGQLEGVAFDCKLSLLHATTMLDTETAPNIGDDVTITIHGVITNAGVQVVAEKQRPYIKADVGTMECHVIKRAS